MLRMPFKGSLKRTAQVAGIVGLAAVLIWSFRWTVRGPVFEVPRVIAQNVYRQQCPQPTTPVVSLYFGLADGSLVQWGCLDTVNGNVILGGKIYVAGPNQVSANDIGSQINAAISCYQLSSCTVIVPQGNYNQTSTINYPTTGIASLEYSRGSKISYTGSACAISISNPAYVNVKISGSGEIDGTSSGTAAICLSKSQGGHISGLTISGFSNGAAIKNIGANTVHFSDLVLENSQYGYWGVGSADGFSPNAVDISDTLLQNNTSWGVFLDASGDGGGGGPQQKVLLLHDTFESNGTNGNPSTGQVFVQTSYSTSIKESYFEYFGGETKTQSILIGDASHLPTNVDVENNFFDSAGTTSTITARCFGINISGNQELATNTNFYNHTSLGGYDNSIFGMNFVNSTNPQVGAVSSSALNVVASNGIFDFLGGQRIESFLVANLPSAASVGARTVYLVTDASTFTVGACVGGGSDYMIAVSNGTTWSCH